jgi:hypothetical protein
MCEAYRRPRQLTSAVAVPPRADAERSAREAGIYELETLRFPCFSATALTFVGVVRRWALVSAELQLPAT